jgi:hypothetical protein
MSRLSAVSLSLVAAVALFSAAPAMAQHDATWKALGMPGQSHQGFSRRMSHARDYAQDLRAYVAPPYKPTPAAVKDIVTELGRNLDAAKKHLADMKKAAGDDKATVAAIAKIESQLATAFEHHKTAHACCVEDFDAAKALKCCDDLSKEIDKIIAEHNDLMKSLAKKSPQPKPAAK